MKIEELLKRRKKVMADFPQWSTFKHKKGDILELKGIHFVGKGTSKSVNVNDADNYPEVLREMEWWEDRDEKDMPEYVWNNTARPKTVIKIDSWYIPQNEDGFIEVWADYNKKSRLIQMWAFTPATKEEYENQNK